MTVSVVTVTYNAADTVADAVQSVIRQKGDFRLDYHIVDGGSNDGTLEQIEPFQDRITEITTGPDDGLYDAMNHGVARAKGDNSLTPRLRLGPVPKGAVRPRRRAKSTTGRRPIFAAKRTVAALRDWASASRRERSPR